MPLPAQLHRSLVQEVRLNIDQYWDNISSVRTVNQTSVEYIITTDSPYGELLPPRVVSIF